MTGTAPGSERDLGYAGIPFREFDESADPAPPRSREPRVTRRHDAATDAATDAGEIVGRAIGYAGIPFDHDDPTPPRRWDPDRPKTEAGFDTIDFAVAEIAAGRAVVVVDDEDRENEGDLIFAAELATPELVGFTVRYSSGVVCVGITGEACDRLDLPPMYHVNQDRKSHRLHRQRGRQGGRHHRYLGRRTGAHRSGCWPTRRPPTTTFPDPATCSRCAPGRAACWSGPGTPRPPST